MKAPAVLFEPGVGVGAERTDNALLSSGNEESDTILVSYVGGKLSDSNGPLSYSVTAGLDYLSYLQNTSEDQQYLKLSGNLNAALVKNRLDYYINNYYNQAPIDALEPNTPDNIEDTNIFSTGMVFSMPVSRRNSIRLVPEYSRFYYETQLTDNHQHSLSFNFDHAFSRLVTGGFLASYRDVNYDIEISPDTDFVTFQLTASRTGKHSLIDFKAGSTKVSRSGQEESGFSGSLDMMRTISRRSSVRFRASTQLTDTSTGRLFLVEVPDSLFPNVEPNYTLQLSTDVIRDRSIRLSYNRDGDYVNSDLWAQGSEFIYSSSLEDRRVISLGLDLGKQFTGTLSGNFFTVLEQTELLERVRNDDKITFNASLGYRHTRKLRSKLAMQYRDSSSTDPFFSYSNWSVFYSLSYGFGEVRQPTTTGGF